jgi:hypothetical protein
MQAVIMAGAESMMKKVIQCKCSRAKLEGPGMMIAEAKPEEEPNSEEEAGDQHQWWVCFDVEDGLEVVDGMLGDMPKTM